MTRVQLFALALVLGAGLALAVLTARGGGTSPVAFDGTVQAHRVPDVTLTDDRGAPLRLDAPKHGAIVVLGYTRCTDECPLTLAKVASALRALGSRPRPRAVFVTVDPAHDDPATLHRYLAAWENAIAGATGEPGTLARLFLALGAGDGRAPLRDHDTRAFILDRHGEVRTELAADASPAAIAATLRALAAEGD
ncbi:MAG TPA: SCO family protein [Candidatus Acidoferrum sp.]|nr:SCO family protein [Candidatus Acidoferrum sp.]